jgi:hypothetical protein
MSDEGISKESFAVLLDRAGLTVPEAEAEELRAAYFYVKEMAARVRTPRGREAEPAHIFALPHPEV